MSARPRIPEQPDTVEDVTARFRALYSSMRAESRACVDHWLESAERQLGGTLIVQAPSASAKRDLPEAALASERFATLAAPLMIGLSCPN